MMISRYYGIFITRIRMAFAYRFNTAARIIASFLSLFIIWSIWKAIYASTTGNVIGGFTFPEMMTYMTLAVIFNALLSTFQEHEIEREVISGKISMYLIKPVSYPIVCFFRTVGIKFAHFFIRIIPLIIVALFVIKITTPVSWIFLLSLGLSYLINFNLVFLTGMMAFWTKGGIWGIRLSRNIIISIFSGSLLPLALFPQWLGEIANILPFTTMFHIPVSIYLGTISGAQIVSSLLLQLAWLVIFTSIAIIVWKIAEKKVFVQGG